MPLPADIVYNNGTIVMVWERQMTISIKNGKENIKKGISNI